MARCGKAYEGLLTTVISADQAPKDSRFSMTAMLLEGAYRRPWGEISLSGKE